MIPEVCLLCKREHQGLSWCSEKPPWNCCCRHCFAMLPSLLPPLLRTTGSNGIFFYFLPSYSSLKIGNKISTRISFLKIETMIFLVLGTQWIFLIFRSEPQAHPHGQQSHASGRSLDLCPPFLPYFLPVFHFGDLSPGLPYPPTAFSVHQETTPFRMTFFAIS